MYINCCYDKNSKLSSDLTNSYFKFLVEGKFDLAPDVSTLTPPPSLKKKKRTTDFKVEPLLLGPVSAHSAESKVNLI